VPPAHAREASVHWLTTATGLSGAKAPLRRCTLRCAIPTAGSNGHSQMQTVLFNQA
jgi:hypothetical protein